jgi:hypothetical protein
VEFGLLYDVEVWVDGHPVEPGHARQRCVTTLDLREPPKFYDFTPATDS